jgi:hypothetical protein
VEDFRGVGVDVRCVIDMVYRVDHYEGEANKIRNKTNYIISFRQAEQNPVTNLRSSVHGTELGSDKTRS